MRRLDYVSAIGEDSDTLLSMERTASSGKVRQRLQLLRLLKSGEAETLPQAAKILGMSKGQVWKQWKQYQVEGLEGFLTIQYRGRRPRLNESELEQLQKQTETGFASIKAARRWIEETLSVEYSNSGVGKLFKRKRIKKKTGRPRHQKQDLESLIDFKKNTMPIKAF